MSKHHIIFKSQGGTDHPFNLIELSEDEHYAIHHGCNIELKKQALKKCYDYALGNDLSKCWQGKIKPKIIRLLEQSNGDYTEIFKQMDKL